MLDRPAVAARALLRLEDIGLALDGMALLEGVTLTIASGAPTVLVGPNGAGKTTLLKIVMGLLQPTAGRAVEPRSVRKAFMFQKPVMLRRSAAANVAFALAAAGRRADVADVADLLDRVGLANFGRRPARTLSGGEQQRLSLARALARAPELLILDEPTASLDPASTKAVEDIVALVAASGVKVLMSTHDLGSARRLAGDVALLVAGRLVEHTGVEKFFRQPATAAARRFLAGEIVI